MSTQLHISGDNAKQDAVLVQAYLGTDNLTLDHHQLTCSQAQQLACNKYAVLPNTWPIGQDPVQDSELAHRIERQQHQHHDWHTLYQEVVPVLEQLGVHYVLMKALKSPFTLMSDVDFLVPDPQDIARITQALESRSYELYHFRLLAHPLKIMAKPTTQHFATSPVSIDLYPDAMWIRKHVLDGWGVISRKKREIIHGKEVWGPCIEDDLYLVATHAFSRGSFMLGELDHGLRLIQDAEFDWSHLWKMALSFGSVDAIYTYLYLLKQLCTQQELAVTVPDDVLREYENHPANHALSRWLAEMSELAFPVQVPIWLCTVRSAFYHLSAIWPRVRVSELAMDAATHGLTIVTHLMKRD